MGNVPDRYRPTLWDFLVYDALQFYQAGEQGGAEDEFEITDASPIFGDTAEFLNWNPVTTDAASPKLKAIRLYQALLKFHQSDAVRSAFYDTDLARLAYGNNVATGEDKDDRYRAALQRISSPPPPIMKSRRGRGRSWPSCSMREANRRRRVNWRGLAWRRFRRAPVGAMCYNLVQRIESKSASLRTELVWNAPWPTLDVMYRNVTKIYFRAVAFDFKTYRARKASGSSAGLVASSSKSC